MSRITEIRLRFPFAMDKRLQINSYISRFVREGHAVLRKEIQVKIGEAGRPWNGLYMTPEPTCD